MTTLMPVAEAAVTSGGVSVAPLAGRLVAVASGKGGVGKTWLSITLAHSWARSGLRVLLCDADFGLANVDVQLGLTPPGDLSAVVSGRLALSEAVAHHRAGFDVLAGRSGSGSLSSLPRDTLETLLDGLHGMATAYDRVLLDLGAGLDRGLRRMAVSADTLLVVVNDEPTSLTDAYAVLKLYALDRRAGDGPAADGLGSRSGAGEARAVVNQVPSLAAGQRVFATLEHACRTYLGGAPKLAGVIRRDEQVRTAIRRQMPLLDLAPGSPAATDVAALARAL